MILSVLSEKVQGNTPREQRRSSSLSVDGPSRFVVSHDKLQVIYGMFPVVVCGRACCSLSVVGRT